MDRFQVFISYRREGGSDIAGRISDKLRYLGYKVFYDLDAMRAGVFDEQIYSALDQCEDVLVILPPNSLDRCINEDDWVRQEIAYSIKTRKNIIPILVRDFSFPDFLPQDIDELRRFEGVKYVHEYFDPTVDRICSLMNSKLENSKTAKDSDVDLDAGIRSMIYGLYDQAKASLQKAMSIDMSNPDVQFYSAVAQLEGKNPFLVSIKNIKNAETFIKTAVSIEEKAKYYYFWALLAHEFYYKKRLNYSPSYNQLLDKALQTGIKSEEIKEIHELLKFEKPVEFELL